MRFTSFVAPASTSVIPATRTVIWRRSASTSVHAFTPTVNFDWGEAELPRRQPVHPVGAGLLVRRRRAALSQAQRHAQLAQQCRGVAPGRRYRRGGQAGDLLVSLYPDDASLGRSLQYTLAARLDSLPEFVSSHLNANTVTLTLQEI